MPFRWFSRKSPAPAPAASTGSPASAVVPPNDPVMTAYRETLQAVFRDLHVMQDRFGAVTGPLETGDIDTARQRFGTLGTDARAARDRLAGVAVPDLPHLAEANGCFVASAEKREQATADLEVLLNKWGTVPDDELVALMNQMVQLFQESNPLLVQGAHILRNVPTLPGHTWQELFASTSSG